MAKLLILSLLLLTGVEAFVVERTAKVESELKARRDRSELEDYPPWYRDQVRTETDYRQSWQYSREPLLYQPHQQVRLPFPDVQLQSDPDDPFPPIPGDQFLKGPTCDYRVAPPSPAVQSTNPQPPTPQSTNDPERALAAGVGTGVLGLLVGGPIGAAVLGFGSAYAAETAPENTLVGDSARAIGDVAIAAGKKSVELNDKHKVVDKTIDMAEQTWEMAKELDREHHLVQKAKDVALYGSAATVEFVRKHNLVERGVKGLGQGIGWVSERVVAGSLDGPAKKGRTTTRSPSKSAAPTSLMPTNPYDNFQGNAPNNRNLLQPDDTDPWQGRRPRKRMQ